MFAKSKSDELRSVFHGCRRYFLTALIFSLGDQPALSRRTALHAPGLRPGDHEREPRHAGDADHRAALRARCARRPRRRARARAHAGERAPRPADGRARARGDHGIVGQGRAADEPDAARLRHLPAVRHRRGHPCRLRSALGADLHLRHLPAASPARRVRAGVGDHARCHGRLRPMARAGPDGGVGRIGVAQLRLHRHEPAQRRGGAGHGHDARPVAALGSATAAGRSSGRSSRATARRTMPALCASCASRCSRSSSGSAPIS